jgi:hypothetical protein
MPAGTPGQWSRARSAVRCTSHVDGAASPPAAVGPRVTGTAGASAQAEYERRRDRRERKVREAHPRLGFLLAVTDEPAHVTAWQKGAAGEREVARRLDQLVTQGFEVMHDRRIRGSRANIDHIAVSSSGVYVIDAKNYTGRVRVNWEGGLFGPRRYELLVGQRDATKLVAGVQHQVELVQAALAEAPHVPITGVLTFFKADWPRFPPDRIDGIRLEGPKSTGKLVLRPGPLPPPRVAEIAARLRAAFPEK